MKTLMQFIDEASIKTDFTPAKDPFYTIEDAEELRVKKPFEVVLGGRVTRGYPAFKVKVQKGDLIFNLPGGIFLKRKSGKYDDFPAGWVNTAVVKKYGASLGKDKDVLSKIVKNSEVIK